MKYSHLFLALFALCFFACEKTIESETNRWTNNQARLERLQSEYPNFSTAIQTHLSAAKTTYEKAQSLTNEESKISMLDQANDLASPSYLRQLDNFDKKVQDLRASSLELMELSENNKGILVAGFKSVNIESRVTESRNYLSSVVVKDEHQARQAVKKALDPIDNMQKSISKSIKDIERKQRETVQ